MSISQIHAKQVSFGSWFSSKPAAQVLVVDSTLGDVVVANVGRAAKNANVTQCPDSDKAVRLLGEGNHFDVIIGDASNGGVKVAKAATEGNKHSWGQIILRAGEDARNSVQELGVRFASNSRLTLDIPEGIRAALASVKK